METLYDAILDAGAEFDIGHFGSYAMNSMRMEKAFKAWGAELTTEITPVEADIMRFVKLDHDFIGRDKVMERKNGDIELQCVYCSVEAADADCLGNEPVYNGDKIIGVVTGGAYGHAVQKSIAFAYVEPGFASPGTTFETSILGNRVKATVEAHALYDPKAERMCS
jgi:dimethylglycine dehydrogenase